MTQDTEPDAIEAEKRRTADEQDLIEMLERLEGRKFTEQEINLSLDQARAFLGRKRSASNRPTGTVRLPPCRSHGKRPDASRRLPQDNAGEAGVQETTAAQADLGTIATGGC